VGSKRLEWDSRFLGIEVYGVYSASTAPCTDIDGIIRRLEDEGAGLAFFFMEDPEPGLQEKLEGRGAVLYDKKITYRKEITPGTTLPPLEIRAYEGDLTDELIDLALLAGHDSRFRKDPRLTAYFEPLYRLWMENSLNGLIADRVFVYGSDAAKGMVSCKIREDGTGSIGLIATAATQQGKGIGKGLLQATDHYYRAHGVRVSTVVTQKSNKGACLFYEKEGFTEYKTEYVYHLWFNSSLL
jgi:dTDP-4-amino-4,6-dideoxy-D-galactose acyltransferase